MRTDSGALKFQPPSWGDCNHCLEKFDLKMQHDEAYCPARKKMIELYRSGKIRPSGIFYQKYGHLYEKAKREREDGRD